MRLPSLRTLTLLAAAFAAVGTAIALPTVAYASVYSGQGILGGIAAATGLGGIVGATSITELIVKVINFILNVVLLLAVLAIIIAGIYLIVSNGEEGQKDKAKKIIMYAIIGIIVILLSRAIVIFVNNIFS